MTSSMAKGMPYGSVPSTGPANWQEVAKFLLMPVVWLSIIFGAVWLACWAVGVLLPAGLERFMPASPLRDVLVQLLQVITPLMAVLVFIPINAMFMVLCERRALALFTVRKGPNRVGPDGWLQTFADALKLLFKEDITPTGADAAMFTLAPILFFAPSVFGAIPLLAAVTVNHPLFAQTNLPTGIFFVIAASAIPVVALVMGGWSSNNKYSLVGGLRSAAQAISYEIPLVMSIVAICLMSGTLDVVKIVQAQVGDPTRPGGFWNWNLFANNAIMHSHDLTSYLAGIALTICTLLFCGIYLTAACAEINRIPFDLPEAESELVSGYNTEYSGIKFAIFFLAEYTNLFIVASIATVLFLGGGSPLLPGFLDPNMMKGLIDLKYGIISNYIQPLVAWTGLDLPWIFSSMVNPVTMSGVLWAVIKVYSIVFLAILVRGTLPRFRIDQLMDFGWKRLIPLTLILLVAVTFLRELVGHA